MEHAQVTAASLWSRPRISWRTRAKKWTFRLARAEFVRANQFACAGSSSGRFTCARAGRVSFRLANRVCPSRVDSICREPSQAGGSFVISPGRTVNGIESEAKGKGARLSFGAASSLKSIVTASYNDAPEAADQEARARHG